MAWCYLEELDEKVSSRFHIVFHLTTAAVKPSTKNKRQPRLPFVFLLAYYAAE